MFDLNERINEWRGSLSGSAVLSEQDLNELESHLREEIENLTDSKLSAEEAFLIATHRLGRAGSLTAEFAKINGLGILRTRLFWMIVGVLTYMLVMQFSAAASQACVFLGGIAGLKGYGSGVVSSASEILILGATLFLCYRLCRQRTGGSAFNRWANGFRARTILLAALAASLVVLATAQIFLRAGTARVMGAQQYGQMAIVSTCTNLALSILLPVAMMILLIMLRRSRLDRIGA
jgi:hypothetical protein